MQIIIRSMKATDAEAVTRLSNQLGYSISIEATLVNIKTLLSLSDNYCLVAIDDSIVVGWVHAFLAHRIESNSFVEIGGLVMDENYRGKGIGRQLIQGIEDWALTKDVPTLRVRSNTKRAAAHRFYAQLQFVVNKQQLVFEKHLHKM